MERYRIMAFVDPNWTNEPEDTWEEDYYIPETADDYPDLYLQGYSHYGTRVDWWVTKEEFWRATKLPLAEAEAELAKLREENPLRYPYTLFQLEAV